MPNPPCPVQFYWTSPFSFKYFAQIVVWAQKNVSFLFNFTRILGFFWDFSRTWLFDIPKAVVFAEILVFSNIFGFPVVNCVPKWNKTVNFGCLPFIRKFKILKDFLNTVFFLLETTSGQNFSKNEQYLRE